MVSFTTLEDYKEQVCIIRAGEHPWTTHDTCVSYENAKVVSLTKLYALKDSGHIKVNVPVSAELLARIREGAVQSARIQLEKAEILFQQGLVE